MLVEVRRDAGARTAPWLMPRLKPCAPDIARTVTIACLVSAAISAASSVVVSV